MTLLLTLITGIFLINVPIQADRYHYKNKIIGSRSIGLGGAFAGVSDDPSGIYYNPAGLTFTDLNAISGNTSSSGNRKTVYLKVVGEENFTEESTTLIPTFLGGTQSIGNLKLGFGIMVPDVEYIEQNDSISTDNYVFSRTYLAKNTLTLYGIGASYPLNDRVSIGFSAFYYLRDMRTVSYQHVIATQKNKEPPDIIQGSVENVKEELIHDAILPILGIQLWPWDRLSIGISASKGYTIDNKNKRSRAHTELLATNADIKTTSGKIAHDKYGAKKWGGSVSSSFFSPKYDLGEHLPWHVLMGMAYFPNSQMVLVLDLDYFTATHEQKTYQHDYNAQAIFNVSTGFEYYALPFLPLSIGFFTNKANTPDVDAQKTNQVEHIDLSGVSGSIGLDQGAATIHLSAIYQFGQGQAQKTAAVQDVKVSQYDITLSGSYAF